MIVNKDFDMGNVALNGTLRINLWHSPLIFQKNGYCFLATYSLPFQLSLYQSTIFAILIPSYSM
jgi:hypothetical protein